VTVLNGHPHTLAFLSSINEMPSMPFRVIKFGVPGAASETRLRGIGSDNIVHAALDLVE
jgi:pyruvate dehydrogenase E1 component